MERAMDKLGMYGRIDALDIDEAKKIGGPLQWWHERKRIYSHLAKLARKYLPMQATSASSERLFSTAGNTVTVKVNRLTGDKVDATVMPH
ncbi:unnamed protein product, partial [Discosporangium mesarthrocarpum]